MSTLGKFPSLAGKVVFVTGGAAGIGSCIVESFLAQGAKVGFVDLNGHAGEEMVQAMAYKGYPQPFFRACDLRNIDDLTKAIKDGAEELGDYSILINNAGHDERHKFDQVTPDYWNDRINVNLRHQFFAAQAVKPYMVKNGGGSIVNLGSVSWLQGNLNMIVYTTAKAAVHGFTKSLARELGPQRIRVNCVLPGWVMTERQVKLWLDAEGERTIKERQCLPDKLQPQDIANYVLFLSADDSRMVTGQAHIVDAGWN